MNHLGKTIRILRQAKGIKLNSLAKSVEVSVPFLSLVENSARQPSIQVVQKIANALGIPSEALILMSVGTDSRLTTSDKATTTITNSVRKLIELEQKLQDALMIEGETDEPREDNSI